MRSIAHSQRALRRVLAPGVARASARHCAAASTGAQGHRGPQQDASRYVGTAALGVAAASALGYHAFGGLECEQVTTSTTTTTTTVTTTRTTSGKGGAKAKHDDNLGPDPIDAKYQFHTDVDRSHTDFSPSRNVWKSFIQLVAENPPEDAFDGLGLVFFWAMKGAPAVARGDNDTMRDAMIRIIDGANASSRTKDCVKLAVQALPFKRDERRYAKSLLVFGSSVSRGAGASDEKFAWASLLGIEAETRGFEYVNAGVGGTFCDFWDDFLSYPDGFFSHHFLDLADHDVVVLSLSLGNEGLAEVQEQHSIDERAMEYAGKLHKVIKKCKEKMKEGAKLVVGGPYPHQRYTTEHLNALREVHKKLQTFEEVHHVIDFLQAPIHDGKGRWADGCMSDEAHPNNTGHEAMFKCLLPDIEKVLGN